MEDFITHFSYLGVVVVLLIAGFGVPLPEDVPLILAGVLCGLGHANIWIMLPLCFAAVMAADITMFSLGRRHGHRVRELPFIGKYLSDERIAKVTRAYNDHVGKTLFLARFMVALRTPMFFVAGSVGIPYWKLFLYDGLAALVSVPLLVLMGYYGAENRDLVLKQATHVQLIILGLIVAGIIGWMIYGRMRRRKSTLVSESKITP